MKERDRIRNIIKEYFIITIGILLTVVGVYFFKFPNNFSTGGVTGIAVVLSKVFGDAISTSTVVLVINFVLIFVGYFFLGKSFGTKTVYASILLSVSLSLLEKIVPISGPLTNEPLLDLAFGVGVPAVGAAILFNIGASSGGTDIIAMILKKYSSIDIGKALFYTDILLTLTSFLVFDLQTSLLSLLGLLIKSLAIDNVIESLNTHKYVTIICDHPEPINDFILHELHRSGTIMTGQGAFTQHEKKVILTVLTRSQAVVLRKAVREVEPTAFMVMTNTSEIIGRGFRA